VPYEAEISRTNPTCFLFLIDQSGSMSQPFGGESGKRKSDGVADAMNRLLQTLVFRTAKGEVILDRYHVGVIGYRDHAQGALAGLPAQQLLVRISEIANHPVRIEQRTKKVEDGAGGLVDQTFQFPVWFEATAGGRTAMCEALDLAQQAVGRFIGEHPDCFPPIVVNITDGEATDGDAEAAASRLKAIASSDGNLLLFNAHLSSRSEQPIQFPNSESQLPDLYARLLFRLSSPLPPGMWKQAKTSGLPVAEGARGFVFNADLVSVIQFLDIGTRVDKNLR